jgi:hypothetical protein
MAPECPACLAVPVASGYFFGDPYIPYHVAAWGMTSMVIIAPVSRARKGAELP